MNKIKRILALLGVILLVGLYLTTLMLAIFGNPNTMDLFMASVVATVIVPVLFFAYSMIYKLLKNHYSISEQDMQKDKKDTDTPS